VAVQVTLLAQRAVVEVAISLVELTIGVRQEDLVLASMEQVALEDLFLTQLELQVVTEVAEYQEQVVQHQVVQVQELTLVEMVVQV
jgi:hypothetical protein